jgi:hypothetical protein
MIFGIKFGLLCEKWEGCNHIFLIGWDMAGEQLNSIQSNHFGFSEQSDFEWPYNASKSGEQRIYLK